MKSSNEIISSDNYPEKKEQSNPNKDQYDSEAFYRTHISKAVLEERRAVIAKIASLLDNPTIPLNIAIMQIDIIYFKLFQPHLKEQYLLPQKVDK